MKQDIKNDTKLVNANVDHNHGYNILRCFDASTNFFSPQVKRSMTISNKHGIYMRVADRLMTYNLRKS